MLSAALLLPGLGGCGQKGPLFMPAKAAPAIATKPVTVPGAAGTAGLAAPAPSADAPAAVVPARPLTPAPVTPQSPAMTLPSGTVVPSNK